MIDRGLAWRSVSAALLCLLAAMISMTSCGSPTSTACTLIACGDFLIVEVLATSTPVEVALYVDGQPDPARVEMCQVREGSCIVGFPDFVHDEVTIRITRDQGSTDFTVQPNYEVVQPNGPRCPPRCRIANVQVSVL